MYSQVTLPAIVLGRTDYNEVDKIVTFLGPKGQFAAIVKGVRRVKSKLAGGIELFSVSQITYLDTKSDLKVVVQSRLIDHYGDIAKDLESMLFAYDCMKMLRRITPEDTDDENYYLSLKVLLESLANPKMDLSLVKIWWLTKVLQLLGNKLELHKDEQLKDLYESEKYTFVVGSARLRQHEGGSVGVREIKLLRLMAEGKTPNQLTPLISKGFTLKNVLRDFEAASKELLI